MHESILRHGFRGLYALFFTCHLAWTLWAGSTSVVWTLAYWSPDAPGWAVALGGLLGLVVVVGGYRLAGALGSLAGWRVDVELGTCRLSGYTQWGVPHGRFTGASGGAVKRSPPTLGGFLAGAVWTVEARSDYLERHVPGAATGERDNGDPSRRSPTC